MKSLALGIYNLTRVSITVTRHPGVRGGPRPFLQKMFAMLLNCPRLGDLRIASEMRGPRVDISRFLTDKLWPDLRCLVVEGDIAFDDKEKLTSFLLRHPKLETLSLPESHETAAAKLAMAGAVSSGSG